MLGELSRHVDLASQGVCARSLLQIFIVDILTWFSSTTEQYQDHFFNKPHVLASARDVTTGIEVGISSCHVRTLDSDLKLRRKVFVRGSCNLSTPQPPIPAQLDGSKASPRSSRSRPQRSWEQDQPRRSCWPELSSFQHLITNGLTIAIRIKLRNVYTNSRWCITTNWNFDIAVSLDLRSNRIRYPPKAQLHPPRPPDPPHQTQHQRHRTTNPKRVRNSTGTG